MRRTRKNPHRKKHADKKLRELQKTYGEEVRRRHMHVERRDGPEGIVIAAVANHVQAAPFVPNVKGMRWKDGQLVPRKGGPR